MGVLEIKEQVRAYIFRNRRNAYMLVVFIPMMIGFIVSVVTPFTVLVPSVGFVTLFFVSCLFITLPQVVSTTIHYDTPKSKAKRSVRSRETIGGFLKNYQGNGARYLRGGLLRGVYITLWSLVLVVPGLFKWYAYMMMPYILRDNPKLSAGEAITKSRSMMKGHKLTLFRLFISYYWFMFIVTTLIWASIGGFIYFFNSFNGEMGLALSFFALCFLLLLYMVLLFFIKPRWEIGKSFFYHSIK